MRRIVVEKTAPGIAYIDIHRFSVAFKLPKARYADRTPAGGVIAFFIEFVGCAGVCGIVEMAESPFAVEA